MSSLHLILPVQYLRRGDAALGAPQKRLMLAVLQTVLDDCEWTPRDRPGTTPTRRDDDSRRQALAYVESRDRSWPFSFENICEATGLDSDGIRNALLAHAA
jgi:hypothetical protein